jgi:hypothetical protein
MNLFTQSFFLLHKNVKILLAILIPVAMEIVATLLFQKTSVPYVILELVAAFIALITTVVAIGWSNEAVTVGEAHSDWKSYRKYALRLFLLSLIEYLLYFIVLFAYVVFIAMGLTEEQLSTIQIDYFLNGQVFWITAVAAVVVLILAILLSLAKYVLVVEQTGVFGAIKTSVKYSLKGFITGFFSGMGIILVFMAAGLAIGIVLGISEAPPKITNVVILLFGTYAQAVFTVFMVGLYHKLKKDA